MDVKNKIREVRLHKKMTQKQLGEKCGIAEPTIRKYELGKLNPKYETVEKIAKALGVTPSYLMGWDDKIEQLLADATAYLEKENKLHAAILEMYGREAMDVLNSFIEATNSQKAAMLCFMLEEKHTHDLFSKYYQLDARGKTTVENVILAEYKAMSDKK